MWSQSFCGDPYPAFHPHSGQTVHDCPWLLLRSRRLMPQLSPSVTLVWQFSPSTELKLPLVSLFWQRGIKCSTAPVWEHAPQWDASYWSSATGRAFFFFFLFPLSRNYTSCRAEVKKMTLSMVSVQRVSYGLSDSQFFIRLCSCVTSTVYT